MTASLDTLFGSANNLVTAVNNLSNEYIKRQGTKTSANLAAATTTTIATGQGWLASVSVIEDGSDEGYIYDSTRTTPLANTAIARIPNVTGVWPINVPYISGLVVVTGTAQEAIIVYS